MVSLHGQKNCFCLLFVFFSLDKITKIKICHMVAKEHPEAIEGRRRLIAVDVLDSEEAAVDAFIVHDDATFDEEDVRSLLGVGVIGEVQYMQKALKPSSLLYYVLKPSKLHMCLNSFSFAVLLFSNPCVSNLDGFNM